MSDTQGASDLDNDMPGLGPQTGNARGGPGQLPSALQGLAQHIFGQGRPNPKFLPPAPQQAQMGSTDGGADRSARTLAPVPANAPQTPPKFNPYTQPIPRDHTQWGQPEAFPRLPQSFEVNGMYGQLGNYFAQHGAFASAPLGAGMSAYSKAYNDAYQKGMDFKMKMAKEQLAMHSAQLEEIERARSIGYADIITRHSIEGTDPRNDLWAKAVETGDPDIIRMAENGDSSEKMRRFLADHEAHIRALSAANKKSDEEDTRDALYGLAPARGEGGGGYDPYTNPAGAHGGVTAPPPWGTLPGSPEAAADDTKRAPGVGDPLDPDKPGKDAEPAQSDTRSDNQKLIDSGAWDMVTGQKPSGAEYGKMTSTIMAKRKLEMEKALRDIAANPNLNRDGNHPEEVLDAVRKQVPEAASTLDQYSKYREGPGIGGRSSSGGPEADMWGLMNPLASKMYPGEKGTGVGAFSGDNFAKRIRFAENTQYQTTLRRVATSAEMGSAVIAASNNLPPEANDPNVFNRAMQQAMDQGTGDPAYVALANAIKRYQSEMNVVIRGGVGGQGETLENLRTINPIFSTPANYRIVVAQDAQMAQAGVNQFKHQYKQMGGGPMPGLDPDAEEQLGNLAKMEPIHQVQPGATVPGSEWRDGKARVWLGPFDERGRLRQNPRDNWELAK